jgi:hypothetical protein
MAAAGYRHGVWHAGCVPSRRRLSLLTAIHHNPEASGAKPLVPVTPSSGNTSLNLSTIEQAFTNAFTSVLEQLGMSPGQFQISTGGAGSNGQLLVNFTLPGKNSPAPPATTATPPTSTAVSTSPAPTPKPPAVSNSETLSLAPDATDDAYWNAQPAAVQPLRTMADETQRAALAEQLASEGYKIDVPIMVWGWDAAKTTELRQSYGYTWVPSLGEQASIPVAPGLTFPGLPSYDPNHPPPGSILVPSAGSSLA